MLKVAIIGCGKIADEHLHQIQRIDGCQVVAACDLEPLMAKQLAERFKIERIFSEVALLLKDSRPNVVHITTPPQSHFALGMQCIDAGCHVYIEKPFAVSTLETEKMISAAESKGVKLTVGHDLQFSAAARRARSLVQNGYIGERAVHIESYYCYDLSDPSYAKALLSDRAHWVRRLPGKLLQNVISHGIARIAEYMNNDSPTVSAHGFTSPVLKEIGENEIIDELRVTISDSLQTTAHFTFSAQMRPSLNLLRIYGTKNGIELDQERETVIKLPGRRYRSYAEKFIPPIGLARQQVANVATNLRKFLANDFHMKSGMKHLIESFYVAVRDGGPPPIAYREILLTARIMDDIFDQLNKAGPDNIPVLARAIGNAPQMRVVV